jgi:hypothetical protein
LHGRPSRLTIAVAAGTVSIAAVAGITASLWSAGAISKTAGTQAADFTTRALTYQGSQQDESLQFLRYKSEAAQRNQRGLVLRIQAAAAEQARKERAKKIAAARKAAAERAAQEAAAQQAAAQQAAAQQQAASQSSPSSSAGSTAQPSGSPQQIAMSMLGSYGWSSDQFSCLDSLWSRESGWSVTASNPGSGAYGIAQAMPGSKMASAGPDWQTNAATQIRWGLGYIQQLYRSPCGAWSHEQATGWY